MKTGFPETSSLFRVGFVASALCAFVFGGTIATAAAADSATAKSRPYILMVFNNPVAGKEAEYNDWYNHIHAGEVASQLGFDDALRFVSSPVPMGGETPRRYVVIYRGKSHDLAQTYAGYFVKSKNAPHGPEMIDHTTNYNDSFAAVGPEIPGRGANNAGKARAKTYVWYVYANAAAGKEAAFEKWFDGDFASAISKVPGFISAQPYLRTAEQLGNATRVPAPAHLILFKVATGDIARTMKDAAREKAKLKSGTADSGSWVSYGFSELGQPIPADK
ncbi:MAG TPA: hypothetical protein VGM68_11860 [Rhizomicrobium sp.]